VLELSHNSALSGQSRQRIIACPIAAHTKQNAWSKATWWSTGQVAWSLLATQHSAPWLPPLPTCAIIWHLCSVCLHHFQHTNVDKDPAGTRCKAGDWSFPVCFPQLLLCDRLIKKAYAVLAPSTVRGIAWVFSSMHPTGSQPSRHHGCCASCASCF